MSDDEFKVDGSDDFLENNTKNEKNKGDEEKSVGQPKSKPEKDSNDLVIQSDNDFLKNQFDKTEPGDESSQEKKGSEFPEGEFPFSEIDDALAGLEEESVEQPVPEEAKVEKEFGMPFEVAGQPVSEETKGEEQPDVPPNQVSQPIPGDIKDEVKPETPFKVQDRFLPEEDIKVEEQPDVPPDQVSQPIPGDIKDEVKPETPFEMQDRFLPEEDIKVEEQPDVPPDQVSQPIPGEAKEEVFVLEDHMTHPEEIVVPEEKEKKEPLEIEKSGDFESTEQVQEQTKQEDISDLVVSNQEFLDMQESDSSPESKSMEAPSSESPVQDDIQKTKEGKDLPHIINEPQLLELTKKAQYKNLEVPENEKISETGEIPETGKKLEEKPVAGDLDGMEQKGFYRPEEISDSVGEKGIPKKVLIFGGIGLLVIIIAVCILFLFSGKKEPGTDSKNIQVPQKSDGTIVGGKKTPVKSTSGENLTLNEKRYTRYLNRAKGFLNKGNLDEAKKNASLAAKIKSTDEVTALLNEISVKKTEIDNKKKLDEIQKAGEKLIEEKKKKAVKPVITEEQVFQKAVKKNTIEAFEDFMERYPSGTLFYEAMRKVNKLKEEALKVQKREILLKAQQKKRAHLRSSYLRLNKAALEKKLAESKIFRNTFEKEVIGNEKVIIDYSTGLMWHMWRNPMIFRKAKLWSMRRYAGYSNWRLPTIEELNSILKMDFRYFTNISLGKYDMWSGDLAYEGSKVIWILQLPSGNPIEVDKREAKYFCSVRTIN